MVELTGPRGDGRLTVAAGGHVSLLHAGGQPEPYVALAGDAPVAGTDCALDKPS